MFSIFSVDLSNILMLGSTTFFEVRLMQQLIWCSFTYNPYDGGLLVVGSVQPLPLNLSGF